MSSSYNTQSRPVQARSAARTQVLGYKPTVSWVQTPAAEKSVPLPEKSVPIGFVLTGCPKMGQSCAVVKPVVGHIKPFHADPNLDGVTVLVSLTAKDREGAGIMLRTVCGEIESGYSGSDWDAAGYVGSFRVCSSKALGPLPALEPNSMAACERQKIIEMLTFTRGNKQDAARRLNIGRQTLYNKIRTYRIPTIDEGRNSKVSLATVEAVAAGRTEEPVTP